MFTKFILCVLLVIVSFCHADISTAELDTKIDQLLEVYRNQIYIANLNEIPATDAYYGWNYKWHFIKLSGHIFCQHGVTKALASIKRSGDTTLSKIGDKTVIHAKLTFDNLGFFFESCQVKANHLFSYNHEINGIVTENSIALQISLTNQGETCIPRVDYIVMDKFDNIHIQTRRGLIHKLENKLVELFTRHFHDQIVPPVNKVLSDQMSQLVPNLQFFDFCTK